jgi:hypothetical protein
MNPASSPDGVSLPENNPSPEAALLMTLRALQQHGDAFSALATPDLRQLQEQGDAAARGDLAHVRRMLAAQVTMLDHLGRHFLVRAAHGCKVADIFERFSRLAMRAQMQSARTAAILERMCRQQAQNRPAAAEGSPAPTPAQPAAPVLSLVPSPPRAAPGNGTPLRRGFGPGMPRCAENSP